MFAKRIDKVLTGLRLPPHSSMSSAQHIDMVSSFIDDAS